MKVTLEFNIPEDRDLHLMALNGATYWRALEEFKATLRSWNKYGVPDEPKSAQQMLDVVNAAWDEATEEVNWEEVS